MTPRTITLARRLVRARLLPVMAATVAAEAAFLSSFASWSGALGLGLVAWLAMGAIRIAAICIVDRADAEFEVAWRRAVNEARERREDERFRKAEAAAKAA